MLKQLILKDCKIEKQNEHEITLYCNTDWQQTDYEVFRYIEKAIEVYEKVHRLVYEVDAPGHSHQL